MSKNVWLPFRIFCFLEIKWHDAKTLNYFWLDTGDTKS